MRNLLKYLLFVLLLTSFLPFGNYLKIKAPTILTRKTQLSTPPPLYLPLIHRVHLLPEMEYIPAGTFQMGCDPEHNSGYPCSIGNSPLHLVYLDTYLIDRYEVTNLQYSECVETGICSPPLNNQSTYYRPSYYNNPIYAHYPVLYVSWYNARDYCEWAGKRLPTEAEWEKAARGSSDTRSFPWGDQPVDCSLANFNAPYQICVGDTTQVGNYPTGISPYHTLDMAGNVSEWVNDWWQEDYYNSAPKSNPTGPPSGSHKVHRGGGWGDFSGAQMVATRNIQLPENGNNVLGFRCAISP